MLVRKKQFFHSLGLFGNRKSRLGEEGEFCFKFELLGHHKKYQIGSWKFESGAQERGFNEDKDLKSSVVGNKCDHSGIENKLGSG